MRGAVDVLDLLLAFHGHAEGDLLHRLRGVLGRAQREEEIGHAFLLAAKLHVAEGNGPLGPRRHGEDARFEHARANPLQQGRIAVLADDLFVGPPGVVCAEQLGRHFPAINQQGHAIDGPIVGQGENEGDFHQPTAGVHEGLRDLHLGHLVGQPGVDLQGVDLIGDRYRFRERGWDAAGDGGQMMIGRGRRTCCAGSTTTNNPWARQARNKKHNDGNPSVQSGEHGKSPYLGISERSPGLSQNSGGSGSNRDYKRRVSRPYSTPIRRSGWAASSRKKLYRFDLCRRRRKIKGRLVFSHLHIGIGPLRFRKEFL